MDDGNALHATQFTAGEVIGHRRFILRTKQLTPGHRQALRDLLGAALPVEPAAVTRGACEAHWLAPEEWLLVCPEAAGASQARIEAALAGAVHHLADVTDAFLVLELDGARVCDVLAKGCSLDLHPSVFLVRQSKRSLLAQIPVLLHRGSKSTFRIYADISVRRHLVTWLRAACDEFTGGGDPFAVVPTTSSLGA